MNIILIMILVANVATFLLILFSIRKISDVYKQFLAFVQPEAEDKPSPLANVVSTFADMIGRSFVQSIKSTFMGKASGEVRAEKAVLGDISQDQAQGSPIGAIMQAFPNLSKTLRRNPQLIDLAMRMLNKNNGGSQLIPSGSESKNQMKFSL